MTALTDRPTPAQPGRSARHQGVVLARNSWRALTSMRTALVLLFLLALASVPGALLPQRSLNTQKVDAYLTAHPVLGPLLDRIGMFEVFASPWFAAIYGLLFVSLIGCLLPRTVDHVRSLRAAPVAAPRNLSRLPHHHETTTDLDVEHAARAVQHRLRRWRTVRRERATGPGEIPVMEISAERGHLREWGNLVFHFSLVGLLVGIGAGKLAGYEGQVIALADGQGGFCNTSTAAYDSFRAGLNVDGTGLEPFCVRVEDFSADYLDTGQAESFLANIDYQVGEDLATNTWRPYDLRVNDPLRLAGDRVYLLGHGYAPRFTVTYPGAESRSETLQFRPEDATTLLSSGTLRFDPPAGLYPDPAERRQNQIAVTGLFAPTAAFHGSVLTSSFPELDDPAVAVDVLRGDTGLDGGRPQSIFALDPELEASGRLVREARVNLRPGESTSLADGTTVSFDSVTEWVSLQTSHDPGQTYVLVFAVTMTAGLMGSLVVKRRRVWVRLVPAAGGERTGGGDPADPGSGTGRTVVQVGGLARTDQAGWGEEFARLSAELLDPDGAPADSRTAERGEDAHRP